MNNGHTTGSQSNETRGDFSGRIPAERPNQPYVPEGGYSWNSGNDRLENTMNQMGGIGSPQGIGNSAMNSMMPDDSPIRDAERDLMNSGNLGEESSLGPTALRGMNARQMPSNTPEMGPAMMGRDPLLKGQARIENRERARGNMPTPEMLQQSVNKSAEMATKNTEVATKSTEMATAALSAEEENPKEMHKLEGKAMHLIARVRGGMPADQFYKAVQDARDEALKEEGSR